MLELTAQMQQEEERLQGIKAEFEAVKEACSVAKRVEVDLKQEVEQLGKKLKVQQEKKSYWSSQLGELREKYVREQELHIAQVEAVVAPVLSENAVSKTADTNTVDTGSTEAEVEMEIGTPSKKGEEEGSEAEGEEKDNSEKTEKKGQKVETLVVMSVEALSSMSDNQRELQDEIADLEKEKKKLEPTVNIDALMQWFKKNALCKARMADLDLITTKRNEVRRVYEDLRNQRLQEFMAGFAVITLKLKEMYQMITLGGDAELELVDSLDPFSEGIVFSVRPPKKSWKNISNLSGGEKTLSSLALVFALHHFRPTALYVSHARSMFRDMAISLFYGCIIKP